jgi:hypothetical protein
MSSAQRWRPATFDGDGVGDLAVGTPGEWVAGQEAAGSVVVLAGARGGELGSRRAAVVLPGSSTGPTATGSRVWNQNSKGVVGWPGRTACSATRTAAPVQSGLPWNLIVGVPWATVGTSRTGLVHQLATTSAGSTGSGSTVFSAATEGLKGNPRAGFGLYLA